MQPPPYIPTLSLSHKFRFLSGTNSGNFSITRGNLLNLLVTATTAITTVRQATAVRLKSVEVWTNPTALGSAPPGVRIEWLGENSPSTIMSDVPMGVRPGHIRAIPPPSSSNRWWSISGMSEADVLFVLGLPANAVIDVTLDMRLVVNESPVAGDVPAGAAVGQVYCDYLDGLASGKLNPDGGYLALP